MYAPLSGGFKFFSNLTPYIEEYRHTTRLYGGYWAASFNIINFSPEQLKNFFSNRLAFHIREKTGSQLSWEGLIWEMDHTEKGITRRMSRAEIRNSVKCTYTDQGDNNRKSTGWYKNTTSIKFYGEIQEILFLDNVTTATAQAYAQTVLAEQAFPWPRIVSAKYVEGELDSQLSVSCVGYSYTMNDKYISIAGGSGAISTYITNVINTDCSQVNTKRITTNAITVDKPSTDVRAWDWLMTLAEVGDGTSPYRIYVGPDRNVIYEPISPRPTIHWHGQKITSSLGVDSSLNKWAVQPGIMRDHTWRPKLLPSAMFLEDVRDGVISEIEVGDQYPIPIFKTDYYTDSNYLAAYERERFKSK